MALVDDVEITIKAGDGGNGSKTFLTVSTSPKVFSDGGNGGNGGNIYFQASHNVSDLSEFRFKKELKAEDGDRGGRGNKYGKTGEDLIVIVPPGTTLTNTANGDTIEIVTIDRPVLIARGGHGGTGNKDFTPNIQKLETIKMEGEPGEEFHLRLVLHIIADIGLIGLPNAGKSSLLDVLTNANPKIGNYPFTTLEPNLGVIGTIVLADIPGLIEGASVGRGLGMQFLKHIEKTKVLLHCIDSTNEDVVEVYETVRKEFEEYGNEILKKEEIILLTKKDLADKELLEKHIKSLNKYKRKILTVSVYDEKSIEELTKVIKKSKEKD